MPLPHNRLHRIPPALRKKLLRVVAHGWIVWERYIQDFIFIHINKTGGRSIEIALRTRYEHKTAQEKRRELGPEIWDEKFTFAIVRNPWDRAVSQYHYRIQSNQSNQGDGCVDFNRWVHKVYAERAPQYHDGSRLFLPQSAWITDEAGQIMVNYVGRFEDLANAFSHVCCQIGKTADLPHRNRSARGDYRSYYSDQSREIIARYFADDIDRFGYTF